MTIPTEGPHIRVGDAEREQAIGVLQQAAAEGRLSSGEVSERLDAALRARTRIDLVSLLEDVVPRAPLEEMLTGVVAPRNLGPGFSWEDPLVLTSRWDDERRIGPWEIPPFLEVNPIAADVYLNCVDAVPVSLVIDVVLMGGAGDFVMVLPDGWGADLRRVSKGVGGVKSSVPENAARGYPQVILRGRTSLGGCKIRHPGRYDEWRRQRALRRLGARRY